MINRPALEAPFPKEIIKTRRGSRGDQLSYAPVSAYVERLNQVFESDWSWRILAHEVHGSEVVVRGALMAAGVEKQGFGGSPITMNKSTGEIISLADDFKAAASDCLKKCASLLGVGLEFYGGGDQDAVTERPTSSPKTGAPVPLRSVPQPVRTNDKPIDGSATRLTARQLKAIYAVGHAAGMADAALRKLTIDRYGVAPEFLNRSDASALITVLGGEQ
jgi:hypothetical protein